MEFSNRFTINNSSFDESKLEDILDEDIATISSELATMVGMVRRSSVLMSSPSVLEIYHAIIDHADPQIALILAAGRDEAGNQLFPSYDLIIKSMYGVGAINNSDPSYYERDIFVDGIRRVSADFAASVLIGQFAQLAVQREHAQLIATNAKENLDRILKVPLGIKSSGDNNNTDNNESKSIYFESKSLRIDTEIVGQCYLSSASDLGWVEFGKYTGVISTAKIVADLADHINEKSLINKQTNIIAAPILATTSKAGVDIHSIELDIRSKDALISTEVISIQFFYGTNQRIPFIWGVDINFLKNYGLTSAILKTRNGKLTTSPIFNNKESGTNVLYFRRRLLDCAGEVITEDRIKREKLVWRISPTMTENEEIDVFRIKVDDEKEQKVLDDRRSSQVATLLLNKLFNLKGETKALGIIVRNDPIDMADPIVGLELVAYTVTDPEAFLILDILEMPIDIEIAIGNIHGVISAFSHKPRSIKVKAEYDVKQPYRNIDRVSTPKLVKLPGSNLLNKYKEVKEIQEAQGHNYKLTDHQYECKRIPPYVY
jgi:hypothetical protein